MREQEAIKRLSRRPVHGDDDEEEELMKLRRFSGESAAIARLHDEGQASLAPRQLDDYELERAMVSVACYLPSNCLPSPASRAFGITSLCFTSTIRCLHAHDTHAALLLWLSENAV